MTKHHTDIPKTLRYIRDVFAPEDKLLKEISNDLIARNIGIHIGAEEGKLLQLLMVMNKVRTVVEVGTLGAYSALWMARALPIGGHIYSIEKDQERYQLARKNVEKARLQEIITILYGDAHDILEQMSAKAPYDMIFIDADKGSYCDYLDWAERHIRKGGLIVGDNTLLFDTVAEDNPPAGTSAESWNTMREFNDRLANPDRYFSTLIPTKEGMTVAVKL